MWHSRRQRPRSFWPAPRFATSGQVQQRKSAIHGLPVTLCMLRVKSDNSQLVHALCVHYRVMEHVGSLESTKEA